MKNLMITAAASALLLGAAACSQASDDIQMGESNYGDVETAEAPNTDADTTIMAENDTMMENDSMSADTADITYLSSNELSADKLIGAEVIGASGEKIATVDDLFINTSGRVESVIFRSGDFIDLAGTKGALAFDQLDLSVDTQSEPRFTVAMTEDAIQQVAEFEQDGLNDYRLASEMIGTTAEFLNSDDSVRINDIIMSNDGKVEYAVVSDSMGMGEEHTLDFGRISIEQGDGGSLVIDSSAEAVSMMPRFEYAAKAETGTKATSDYSNRAGDAEWDNGTDTELSPDTEIEESMPQ